MNFYRSCLIYIFSTIVFFVKTTCVYSQDSISRYDHLINAIGMVESGMNDKAKSGPHAGFLQISVIMVKDLNIKLKQRGLKKQYALNDRFNREKSIEMYRMFMNIYKPNSDHQAILMWNEGISAKKKPLRKTRYYKKVMKHLTN